tara:strand:- start:1107 stop:2162 length:1056 start_codon:yes stop_codon:yes gene_type:complete
MGLGELSRKPPEHPGASYFAEKSALIRKLDAEKLNACVIYNDEMFEPEQSKHGSFGIFNPSCVQNGNKVGIIARAEHSEATWHGRFLTDKATPLWSEAIVSDRLHFNMLHKPMSPGMPSAVRSEDWRLFKYNNEVWSNFTTYFFLNDGWPQKDVKARTCIGKLDSGYHIRFIKEMELPLMADEEKNWVFFEHNGKAKFIYKLEPMTICECDSDWNVKSTEVYPLYFDRRSEHSFIANSTNPILLTLPKWGEVYFMMYHYFLDPYAEMGGSRNRTYYQFAYIFDKNTLKPLAHTYRPVVGGGRGQGRHNNVIYISGVIDSPEIIHFLAGEGDTYSRVIGVSKSILADNLVKL